MALIVAKLKSLYKLIKSESYDWIKGSLRRIWRMNFKQAELLNARLENGETELTWRAIDDIAKILNINPLS